MILYVRQLGWLHATPKGREKSRLKSFQDVDENHPSLEMPDVETDHAASYLISLLQEAGLMSSTGMGPVPLSWVDIRAWIDIAQRDLSMWERLTIKRLSEEYVSELVQASDVMRVAPYQKKIEVMIEEVDREAVQNKILSVFSMFKKRNPDGTPKEES